MPTSDPVADQYVKYPYPEIGDDIPTWLRRYNYDFYDPRAYAPSFWPEGRPKKALDILVAGCGTMQGAVIAFLNPECSVTGVDFSQSSIAHEERLRTRHNLTNLTLHVMDLREVRNLGKSFHFILSTGVLHHLADPGEGLRALGSVLDPVHGAMILMLYGRAGRIGIYLLQDAFRRMGVQQTPEGVHTVRSIMKRIPSFHSGRFYYEHSPEMPVDAAVVDTYLHPQDRAFSVPEILEFIETNGLRFQNWIDSGEYNLDWEELDRDIPEREHWCIAENLKASIPTHHFVVCRPERHSKSSISFGGDRWLSYFPRPHPTTIQSAFQKGTYCRSSFGIGGTREYSVSPAEAVILTEANGKREVSSILRHRDFQRWTTSELTSMTRAFFERMWRFGHMHFSKVPL
jgi:SAM-dependent methyltransferase